MKQIKIQIGINEGKIATKREFEGYDENNISDQFEVLGIMENLMEIQKERIKVLLKVSS